MSRDDWNITEQAIFHLSFTVELVAIRQEMLLQEACGLNLSEWRVLSLVYSFGTLSSKDITRLTTINKVTLSRTVAKLTAEGLLERTVSDADSRVQNLTLTRTGLRRFHKAREAFEQWSGDLLSSVAAPELQELKAVLGKIRARLGQITGDERALNESFARDLRA
jgi:DNA-binding MarR family transcriptional regulator